MCWTDQTARLDAVRRSTHFERHRTTNLIPLATMGRGSFWGTAPSDVGNAQALSLLQEMILSHLNGWLYMIGDHNGFRSLR